VWLAQEVTRLVGFCEPEEKSIKFWPTFAPVQLESIAGIVVEFFSVPRLARRAATERFAGGIVLGSRP
jgi:hypothetical protein